MSEVEKNITIAAPIDRVWEALTDPEAIGEWMLDEEVRVDLRPGGAYAFFDGQTTGEFTQIRPQTLLEYTWRQSEWPSDYTDSLVHWELQPDGNSTHIYLLHSNFPNDDERNG